MRRPRRTELVLGTALAAALVGLVTVLLTGARSAPSDSSDTRPITASHTHPAQKHQHSPSAHRTHRAKLPPTAAAPATFVGDLQAGVISGHGRAGARAKTVAHSERLLVPPCECETDRPA